MASSLAQRPAVGSLAGAAKALADGSMTSVALCQSLLARHREIVGDIKSFLAVDEASILAAAEASDQRRAAGNALGAYDGIPVAIKDNISVDGQQCSCASQILKGFTAVYDATVIARLKAQGMIPFGRTNMDEFAMGSSTEHSSYQETSNPHDPDCVPGGSSGGSAAAVAAGEALVALGSDTGGSIRQPAGFCGVIGLKPTYGRVSRFGLVAYASSLDQIGPLANTVEDAAIMLDLIGGHDWQDSTSLPQACEGFAASLAAADVKGLKVGLPKEFFQVEGLDADVIAAIERTKYALQKGGAEIVEVALPHTKYAVATYYVIATAEASSNLARFDGIRYGHRSADAEDLLGTYFKSREEGFGDEVKRRIILGTYVLSSGYYDAYYLRAQKVRTRIRQDYEEAFKQCDVILSPTSPTPAFKRGAVTNPLQMYLADIYTIPVNLAGNCAISIPAMRAGSGLPVGVQLIGNALDESTILKTAHWLTTAGGLGLDAEEAGQ